VRLALQIDAPDIVKAIGTRSEWYSVCSAIPELARAPPPFGGDDVLAGDLLHLQPREMITIPFTILVHKSKEIQSLPVVGGQRGSAAVMQRPILSSSIDAVRHVHIKLMNKATQDTVCTGISCIPSNKGVRHIRRQDAYRKLVVR
jgi:hypothetical protein